MCFVKGFNLTEKKPDRVFGFFLIHGFLDSLCSSNILGSNVRLVSVWVSKMLGSEIIDALLFAKHLPDFLDRIP